MEDASRATTARVSYLAVTGPATEAEAEPFVGSLLVRGCRVIVSSGAAEQAALLADAGRYPSTRFVVTSPATGPANVTALAFTPSGLRADLRRLGNGVWT
jgi:basic membrane lipoprotein Med (substrate-binding protein (PBP1-ABC) superfamily)